MNESVVEQSALEYLAGLGDTTRPGAEFAPDHANAERAGWDQVILARRLRDRVAAINPTLPAEAVEDAVRRVLTLDGPGLIAANRALHKRLVEGVDVEYRRKDGSIAGDKAWLIDWRRPENNEFLAVNQFTIVEDVPGVGRHQRRADIVLFINGLPLVVFELKSAIEPNATVRNAWNQIQTYKAEIPNLFAANAFCIVSDGLEARAGTITADWERFAPWRTVDGESLIPRGTLELQTLVKGMLDKGRLLDLIRRFIVFEEDERGRVVKKLAGYHQYHAVNKAVEQTVRAAGAGGDRRVGVVWHTQGSGKSLSMAFYAGKVVAHPAMQNPTLVVLTDRNDLDDQLFGTFAGCRDLLRQTPVQADSRENLRQLLQVASGGVIFTTIQKFLPDTLGQRLPALSDRRNIVVIADEAHRSQYGLRAKVVQTEEEAILAYGLAQHVRDALPSASFIGFTGTPIESDDRSTPAVFGDYIDVYDIQRAVEDKATVPIFYEARLARLELRDDERPKLDTEFDEITEGEEAEAREKLKTKWAAMEKLVGSDARLKQIAQDLVAHFEQRTEAMAGKGMIVCMSRRICVDLYDQIIALRPDWHSDDAEKGALKVVMTGSADDPPAYRPHVRNKAQSRALAKRFKQPADELKLVIVRDMWLTGFDAPCCHTMYVDKPMHGHSLMQAIARVNRVFKDKPGGLVVDYLGLADQLKRALRDYTASGGGGTPTFDQQQAIDQLRLQYDQCCGILHGFDWGHWRSGTPAQRLELLPAAQEHVLGLENGKKRFLDCTAALSKAFALAAGSDEAMALREDVAFFQSVRAALTKTTIEGQRAAENLDSAINQLITRAVASSGVLDIFSAAGLKNPDISILSDEFLEEVQALPQRNLALELLKKLINGEIKSRQRKNVVQARRFSEMLEKQIRAYQNRAIEAAQVIEHLIDMARALRDADRRGEQLGMNLEETAFYDALADNESARQVMGDQQLMVIARELVQVVKQNVSIDWTVKESVQAHLRRLVKRILRKYGYPPDLQERATQTVLDQAEVLGAEWA